MQFQKHFFSLKFHQLVFLFSTLLLVTLNAQSIEFTDSFEGSSFDPFWSLYEANGSVDVTTDESSSDDQSAILTAGSDGVTRNIALMHFFDKQMCGIIKVKFFDTAPGQESLYSGLYLYNNSVAPNSPGESFFSLAYDWDGDYYWVKDGYQEIRTDIQRSYGWHDFEIVINKQGAEFYIDGFQVATSVGDFSFDQVNLRVYGPAYRPDAYYYFDDFSIYAYPAKLNLSEYVALATNSMVLRKNAQINSGSIGVNDAGTPPFVGANAELTLAKNTSTPAGYEVKANSIKVRKNATVAGDVTCNSIQTNGYLTANLFNPLDLPMFTNLPEFIAGTPGSENIKVKKRKSLELPAGDYGDIKVERNGDLIFTGGVYNINSLNTKSGCKIKFSAPTELRIKTFFDTDICCYIGPDHNSGIGASDIVIYVEGTNGGGKSFQAGMCNTVAACVYAPNGKLHLRAGTNATGAFIGRDVVIGMKCSVNLDTYWTEAQLLPKYAANDLDVSSELLPTSIELHQNYPNPFNPTTIIKFTLADVTNTKLLVYNALGELVSVLVDQIKEAGSYNIGFDATGLASGLYFYVLKTDDVNITKKMMLIK